MKKNVKILISVVLVIALLIVGIVVLLKADGTTSDEPQPTATPTSRYDAYKAERDDIDSFVITCEGNKLIFKNTGEGTWSVNGIEYDSLDSSKVETLLGSVCVMMSNNEIEIGAQDLAKYGLENPYITIDMRRKDGTEDRLLIGDMSPTLGEYFFTVDGSGDIYSIYSYKVDTIQKPASYYTTFNRFSVPIDDITNIKMERRGMDNLELRVKNITEADGYSVAWEIVQPYKQVFNGIDQFISDKILTPIEDLTISAPADKGVDYGFDNPSAKLTLEIQPYNDQSGTRDEAYTETVIVGNSADGVTYVRYKDNAYAVTSGDISFVYTDAFLTVSKLQALVDIQNTDKVTVTYPSGSFVMDIEHDKSNDDMTFKINGNEIDSKEAKQLYQSIISLNIDAVYNSEPMGDAEITIVFDGYDGGENVKIEFKPINELNYALERNGETYFVIKKTKLDEMLAKLNEYAY